MKSWQRNLTLFGILIVGLGALGTYAVRSYSIQNYDEVKQVEAGSIKSITVDTSSTNINIIPSSDQTASAHFYGRSRDNNYKLNVKTAGDTLQVSITRPESTTWFSIGGSSTTLEVKVPQHVYDRLVVNSSSGNIHIDNLQVKTMESKASSGNQELQRLTGDSYRVQAASGNLKLEDVLATATLDLHTSSGNMTGHNLSGKKVTAEAASGNIKLDGLAGEVNSNTSSGNITLRYSKLDSPSTVSASSGNIDLYLPSDASFQFTHKASSGSFESAFATVYTSESKHLHQGTVGSGGPTLTLETASGNLRMHKQ